MTRLSKKPSPPNVPFLFNFEIKDACPDLPLILPRNRSNLSEVLKVRSMIGTTNMFLTGVNTSDPAYMPPGEEKAYQIFDHVRFKMNCHYHT